MAKGKIANPKGPKTSSRPALTIEGRENQMIALAVDLAEQQLRDGTASSQVITHYLKLGATTAKIDKELKMRELDLMIAKTESLKSQKRMDELYAEAIAAMKNYAGQGDPDEY